MNSCLIKFDTFKIALLFRFARKKFMSRKFLLTVHVFTADG